MSPFLRKVKTASGATAVQIVEKQGRRNVVMEHLGSAHDQAQLAALMAAGRDKLAAPDQAMLDFGPRTVRQSAVVTGSRSALLVEAVQRAWSVLGFDAVADEAFFQLVAARIVEPTSVSDSARVLGEIGLAPVHRATMHRCLQRAAQRGYRDRLAAACHAHAHQCGDATLVLYDVTTLYFEAEHEDELRKVGYSKERRVDPQIIVGLLVDRYGFPLEIGSWEGNKAETTTIVPTIEAFQARHSLSDVVVVADAGMLSTTNLKALDEAGLQFIVGSRTVKAPGDLAKHFRWHGDAFTDGQLIDTITPRANTAAARAINDVNVKAEPAWDPQQHTLSWRAVWHYSHKRALHDRKTLQAQEDKARAVVTGEKTTRTPRFVTSSKGSLVLDSASLTRAKQLVGLKGYVTNIPATTMPAQEVVDSYHDLWHVEQSFRMSKHDLRARPIFHHQADAIEAHLTIVFAALAVSRWLQNTTGTTIKRLVRQLRPLREVTITIAGQTITAQPQLDPETAETIDKILGH